MPTLKELVIGAVVSWISDGYTKVKVVILFVQNLEIEKVTRLFTGSHSNDWMVMVVMMILLILWWLL